MNQQPLLFKLAIPKFRKAIKQRRERDQKCPRRRVEEYKDVDITRGERLPMKTGSRRSTERIARKDTFLQELFEEVADGLHAFLIASSFRVS